MKRIVTIFLICLLPISILGQSKYNYKQGYRFIRKAENKLKNGNLIKATVFIKKAQLSNYGFCGNAWASAFSRINLIQAQIYNQQKDYNKALQTLDSINECSFGADCKARDSLKIVTLILKFGKQKVKESFNKITTLEKEEKNFETFYFVNLIELNYIFKFNYAFYYEDISNNEIPKQEKSENLFLDAFKRHNYYKLIE